MADRQITSWACMEAEHKRCWKRQAKFFANGDGAVCDCECHKEKVPA